MDIPVLLEPTPTGFRASTGAPLNLTAEAATATDAVKSVTFLVAAKLRGGCQIVNIGVEATRLAEAWTSLANNPFLDEWDAAIKECRRQRDAEEEAEEAAREAEAARAAEAGDHNGHPAPAPTKSEPAA
jgi:hypothetical protein